MSLTSRITGFFKVTAVALALIVPAFAAISEADARAGGGGSSGSRGSRTFSAPAATTTAPNAAQPMQRTTTPNVGTPATVGQNKGGLFNRPGGLFGGGLLGGLAAGFLGAGLFGMLFGGGLFSGLGGFSSIIGLLLQVALVVIVAKLALNWWRRRNAPSPAYAGPNNFDAAQQAPPPAGGFGGFGGGQSAAPVEIKPADYDAFERLLGDVQAAWSREDVPAMAKLMTPEMESYLAQDLRANQEKGVVNSVSNVKLLQGDLSEAWREGSSEYASVAMRFQLVDKTIDRASGRVVEGGDQPIEATEVWTFVRVNGNDWELSGIQQT